MTVEGVNRIRCDHCGYQTVFSGSMQTREDVERSLRQWWIVMDTLQGRYVYDTERCARLEHPDAPSEAIDVTNLEERADEWAGHIPDDLTHYSPQEIIGTREMVRRVVRHLRRFYASDSYMTIGDEEAPPPWPIYYPKREEVVVVRVWRKEARDGASHP